MFIWINLKKKQVSKMKRRMRASYINVNKYCFQEDERITETHI